MATATRAKASRNGHARAGPDPSRHPLVGLVGGPVKRPWREGTLTRAAELEALSAWMVGTCGANGNGRRAQCTGVLADAIARHLKAARDATNGRRYFSRDGSRLERAMSNLDAAEAALLNIAPDEYLLGQMPGLLNHVQRHLRPTDPRRREMERIAQSVGVKDPRNPWTAATAKTPSAKRNEIANQRGTIVSAVRGASSAALREQTQVRSFYFVLIAVTAVMTCAAIGLGVMAWRHPSLIPLCFEPTMGDETVVVCPTGQSEPLPVQQDGVTPPQDVDDAIDATVSPSDMVLVEVIGATAATIAAAAAIRRTRGSSEPYGVPVALAALKLPTGAATAVLGLLLMRGEFIPGLSALDSSAQIVSWAIVFGYAQQLFTRFVDQQGNTVLDSVRGGPASVTHPADLAG